MRRRDLLTELPALQGDLGLNIREAHAFNTNDSFSLDVFVVDQWQPQVSATANTQGVSCDPCVIRGHTMCREVWEHAVRIVAAKM